MAKNNAAVKAKPAQVDEDEVEDEDSNDDEIVIIDDEEVVEEETEEEVSSNGKKGEPKVVAGRIHTYTDLYLEPSTMEKLKKLATHTKYSDLLPHIPKGMPLGPVNQVEGKVKPERVVGIKGYLSFLAFKHLIHFIDEAYEARKEELSKAPETKEAKPKKEVDPKVAAAQANNKTRTAMLHLQSLGLLPSGTKIPDEIKIERPKKAQVKPVEEAGTA
jgi:hypothetical protein